MRHGQTGGRLTGLGTEGADADERAASPSARARPAAASGTPGDALAETLADAEQAAADVRAGTRAVTFGIAVRRRGAVAADAALGEAAGHARTAAAASADARGALARGEALVGALARLARQTQRTALNASIEAARVGDDGRAFAAVADAMRRLADEAGAAARTAAAEMAAVQDAAGRAVLAAQRSAELVDAARAPVRGLAEGLGTLWEDAAGAEEAAALLLAHAERLKDAV